MTPPAAKGKQTRSIDMTRFANIPPLTKHESDRLMRIGAAAGVPDCAVQFLINTKTPGDQAEYMIRRVATKNGPQAMWAASTASIQ